ncbi:MAG: MBL fold metallo-hydrolase [Pseudorhodobacter sp.]
MTRKLSLSRRGFLRSGGLLAAAPLAAPFIATGLLPGAAQARITTPALSQTSWYRFKIGGYEATILSDGLLNLGSAADQFPGADPAEVQQIMDDEFLPMTPMMLEQNCLIVKTADRLVLFDSGMGSTKLFGDDSGRLFANIRAAGFDPEAITDIVVTHAHCDHVWGIMADDGTPHFPNADIHLSQADFDFWTDEAKLGTEGFVGTFVEGARRNLLPRRDRIFFVEDGKEVLPGIRAVFTPGHTVGHTSYVITSDGQSFLNVGDVVHHYALLFRNPQWEFAFDTDPAMAATTRIRLYEMAVSEQLPMIGYHFPFPGLGNIRRDGQAFRYVPMPYQHG